MNKTENETKTEKENENKNKKEQTESLEKRQIFEKMLNHYLVTDNIPYTTKEFEIRFGSNPKLAKPISNIDYDNVVKQLYSCGFKCENENGVQILRIQNEYTDPKTAMTRISNIRAEIVGTDLIQEYCRTNDIKKLIDMPSTRHEKIKFTQKTSATMPDGSFIKPLDMTDYNFRVSHQFEREFNVNTKVSREIISKWADSKKLFRCMNRVRFYHKDYPIFVDISIVKSSKKMNKVPIPQYTIQEAGVFQNSEHYEIELELDNHRIGNGKEYNHLKQLLDMVRKCIRIILSGLQGTNYPIPYSEREDILQEYIKIIRSEPEEGNFKKRVTSKDFIGPSSYTLQLENIIKKNDSSNVSNIRENYCVTDKADGDRSLLFISSKGRIYLIDTNMNVLFTGMKTSEKTIYNSILDGEYIKHNKNSDFIQLYAAFDLYYVDKKSVREYEFVSPIITEENEKKQRLLLLNKLIDLMKPQSILPNEKSTGFRIQCKNFEIASLEKTIFECCSKILSNIKDGLYEYNTDGLIFTPTNTGVGSDTIGKSGPLYKSTWEQSFKWKPPEFNTIDFLVTIKKDKNGKDEIHNVFQEGLNLEGVQAVQQYKTLVLRCGFDEKKHGYLNPCQDVIDDKLPSPDDVDNEDTYKPVPFQPTNPYDMNACYTNIYLTGNNMMTEENQYFEEDMIVEFKYDMTKKDGWKWIPLRVRYDKTSELRNGMKNYGNAYHVANSNWHSIHHPITESMISTGENIPDVSVSEEVYYNRSNEESNTRGLRDFHNLYVKKKLIMGVSRRGDTFIDYAVGKGGDLSKWIASGLSFVFGIDISKDNIQNHLDGACARYLTSRKKNRHMPSALFVVGDSSINIRSGKAFSNEKDKQITNAVFGIGPKDSNFLGKGVYRQYGVAHNGFQVSSCQFALHYFFENKTTLHGFMRNLAECTKVQGYFIGTCYDGMTVFQLLKQKKKGDSKTILLNEKRIFEITKQYDETGFPEDDMSLGYAIDVYQESINQTFREYLVNFEYLIRIMDDYGFVLITKEEAQNKNLPDNTGLFSELFTFMQNELKSSKMINSYGTAYYMTPEEKQISFMNRYFVFKKVRNVNTDKITKILSQEDKIVNEIEEEIVKEIKEDIQKSEGEPPVKKIIRKSKKSKFVIKKPEKETTEKPSSSVPVLVPDEEIQSKISGETIKIKIKKPGK